jgi:cellulose synthase (UDP-forming)
MTGSPMWKDFESGDSIFMKLLRFVVLVGGVFVLGFTGILDLTWPQQAVLGLLTVLLAI